MSNSCYLSDETNCDLVEVHIDGTVYWIKEDIADEYPLKKLKDMILSKIEENNKKKEAAINQLTEAAKTLGLSKEDLGRLLLGKEANTQPATPPASRRSVPIPAPIPDTQEDDDFREVDGNLKETKPNVSIADDAPATLMPGYSRLTYKDGDTEKQVIETNKRVKQLDNGILEKSDFGTTVIRIDKQDSSQVEKLLRQVDGEGNLVRGSAINTGKKVSGSRTLSCPLCKGNGIARNHQKCPKCGGTGFITV